ncbi:MAG: hypothetical protein RLY78_4096 [Pseudomonadota bacterium]|jgi:cytochrome c|uniref:C-type cytochrome n=1 Tax=Pseudaquabacterium rugosum TaxID=2984194 RepID=A0ABU9B6Z0_9BURK
MNKYVLVAALAVAAAAPAFAAEDMTKMAQEKSCLACHAVDKKLIGPGFKEVAAKYAGQKDAVAKLTDKVMKGGAGSFGQVPMPANPQVNAEQAKALVTWILALK